MHGTANEDDIPIYSAVCTALESSGVEQKPHDGDNEVTVLVDRTASGNYFEGQLIPQSSQLSLLQGHQSPLLDFTEDTIDDNYVSSEKMLRNLLDYTAALDFNTDILVDCGDLHSESPRGGVSPSKQATPQEPVPSFPLLSSLTPTSMFALVSRQHQPQHQRH